MAGTDQISSMGGRPGRLEAFLQNPVHHQGSTLETGFRILMQVHSSFRLELIGLVTNQLFGFSPSEQPSQSSHLGDVMGAVSAVTRKTVPIAACQRGTKTRPIYEYPMLGMGEKASGETRDGTKHMAGNSSVFGWHQHNTRLRGMHFNGPGSGL